MTEVTKLAPPDDDAQDLEEADFFNVKRELKHAVVEAMGKRVYFYDPISVGERAMLERGIHFSADNTSYVLDREAIIDAIIARARKKDGTQLFFRHHRRRLLELPDDRITGLWNALNPGELSLEEMVENAKKN